MRDLFADDHGANPAVEPVVPEGGSVAARPLTAGHWTPIDGETLRQASQGDPEALGRFFEHHFDRIFAVVHRLIGDVHSSEDITQEVFLKIRRHIARLDIERDPAPWLYTVAVNACRDHCRSAPWRWMKRSAPLDTEAVERIRSDSPDPEQELLDSEERLRVRKAVATLPMDLRISVTLHDLEGLPHEQIAQITGTSHDAARKRHSRALRLLAARLEEL